MKYHYCNEEQLIRDIGKGDSNAYQFTFELYYEQLCRYVYSFTTDYDLAEDLVQNSFASLWKNHKSIIITTSLKNYLYRSCYNNYIDFYRKNKKIRESLEKIRYTEIQNLQIDMEINSEDFNLKKKKIEKAVNSLPEKCRQIFILNKYEGLRYKEIAKDLGVSVKTIENQISIAIKKLKKELKE
jgi:RNA polymerase sigma-70 factor (ECF subfamily)